MKQKQITKGTKIEDALENEKVAEIFFQTGIGCFSCGMAQFETIEQGLKGHGFTDKEIDEVIKEINEK